MIPQTTVKILAEIVKEELARIKRESEQDKE